MGFTELADLDCTVTTALGGRDKKNNKNNPTQIEGYYIGSRQVASPKSKTGFAALHVFQTEEGNVGVWGKTNLDQKMKQVTPGSMTRVTFTGMMETKNNPMYKYKVEVDSSNTIDVSSAVPVKDSYESDDSYSDESLDESSAEEAVEYVAPKAPKQAAKTPSAEQQARVKALLNGTRNKAS